MVDKELIMTVFDNVLNDYSDITVKCSIIKSSPYYAMAMEMSEKYGLKIKRCTRKELRFEDEDRVNPVNDKIKSTELRFDNALTSQHIDFTNTGSERDDVFTIDEILGYYDSMPSVLKNSVGIICFTDSDANNHSSIYDPFLHRENVIHITNDAYVGKTKYDSEGHNPERIMAHEMGHCLDYGKLNAKDKNIIKRVITKEGSLSKEETTYFLDTMVHKLHIYSGTNGVFQRAVIREANDKSPIEDWGDLINVIPSSYAKKYFMKTSDERISLSEHFAETVSMVSFKNKSDKSNAVIETGDVFLASMGLGDVQDYDEFMATNGQTVSIPVVEKLLEL